LALVQEGYEVVGTDILAQTDAPFEVIAGDLSHPEQCEEVAEKAGDIDILVCAHGLLQPRSIENTTVDDFNHAVAVNLRSVFLLNQKAAPQMADRGWGRLINFSSVVAHSGGRTSAAYAAAKAGVIAMTKSFASEYADRGVTCNSIAPAAIDTELNAFLTPEHRASIESQIPVGRFSTPEEFAGLVRYLCSDSAGFITGATLDVNGGWVMR
jgi:NAD(P)-dependent dehydrogenase (short-subunit alcohol dehydrogenase family)